MGEEAQYERTEDVWEECRSEVENLEVEQCGAGEDVNETAPAAVDELILVERLGEGTWTVSGGIEGADVGTGG